MSDKDWILSRMGENPNSNNDNGNSLVYSQEYNDVRNKQVVTSNQNNKLDNTSKNNSIINNNQNRNMNKNPQSNLDLENFYSSLHNQQNQHIETSLEKRIRIKQEVVDRLNIVTKDIDHPDNNLLKSEMIKILNYYNEPEAIKNEIMQEILWDINGYGVIEPFLHDDNITEIICCSFDNIWIEKGGKLYPTDVKFSNEKDLKKIVDKIVQPLGRKVDDSQPYVNARLVDQSRVNVVIDPICADGTTLDIRKFARQVFTMEDYIERKTMCREMTEFIKWTTIIRKNMVVSGGTGSGKTTLLNCISRFIPDNEAIITIEDLLELQLIQPCLRRLEARGPNADGKGAVTIRDLVVNALRMRPDRIIVGECRSFEIVDMLQAMNTGHDGSLTTVHSNSSKECIERLTTMYLFSGLDIPDKAIKSQIATAIHIIIQAQRLDNGDRKITQISEVLGLGRRGVEKNNQNVEKYNLNHKFLIKNCDNNEVYIQDIFRYNEFTDCFERTGWVPTFFEKLKLKGCPLTLDDFSEKEIKM